MTLDEAIKHCLEVAEQWEERANTPYKVEDSELQDNACRECAADHRQLAEWLTELKEAKRLLQLAWDDIQTLNDATVDDEGNCLIEDKFESCTECPLFCESKRYCGWRYQVDALMLIGGKHNEH